MESYLKTLLETESCLLSNMASFCCQEEVCVSIYSRRSQTAASKTPHRKKNKTTEEFIIQRYKQSSLRKYYKSFFTGV